MLWVCTPPRAAASRRDIMAAAPRGCVPRYAVRRMQSRYRGRQARARAARARVLAGGALQQHRGWLTLDKDKQTGKEPAQAQNTIRRDG